MDTQELRNLQEAYMEVYQELDEGYQEPRFNRKDYLAKLSKRGGMGMGTPEDPHGYRDPKMAKVGAEFSKRKTAAAKAKKTGQPDSYRAEKEAQSKLKKEQVDLYDIILSHLLDEGYAETPEAAEAIMVNMSEEWREDIVEAMSSYDRNRKRAAERAAARNAARDRGQTGAVPGVGYVSPRRERETWTDESGQERHKSGARMPK
jgi:hypothetical protein